MCGDSRKLGFALWTCEVMALFLGDELGSDLCFRKLRVVLWVCGVGRSGRWKLHAVIQKPGCQVGGVR